MPQMNHHNWNTTRRALSSASYRVMVVLFGLMSAAFSVAAEDARLLLIYNNTDRSHLGYVSALRKILSDRLPGISISEASLKSQTPNNSLAYADIYVTVGVEAFSYLSVNSVAKPTLYTLMPLRKIPEPDVAKQLSCYPQCYFSVLDQPMERQLKLIRHALPGLKRIGVLYGSDSSRLAGALLRENSSSPVQLTLFQFDKDRSLIKNLDVVLNGVDLLFAFPDPEIYNSQTARSIFLTAFREEVPIYGYSEAYTRAGALFSLHSSPEEFARSDFELLSKIVTGANPKGGLRVPEYYSVSTNKTVARSLEIDLDSAEDLTDWLRKNDDISANH